MPAQKVDPKLSQAMKASLKAYASGSPTFFRFLDDKVRVFAIGSAEPTIGRAAFQSAFGATFTKVKRQVGVMAQDVQMSGDQAILSQTLKVTGNGVSTFVRQTVVWGVKDGDWKMRHIHNAMVGEPVGVGRPPTSPRGVRILNERIATAATVVGVAQ